MKIKLKFRKVITNCLYNILFSIIGLIFFILIMEIVIRISVQDIDSYIVLDKDIGALRKPYSQGTHKTPEYETHFSINSLGFRDNEHSLHKPSDVFRIAFIGDSITEATQVEFEERFSYLLEEKLNSIQSPYKFEVFNFGVGGVGTSQEYYVLKKYVNQFKPDLVISQLSIGDTLFNIHKPGDEDIPHITYLDLDKNNNLIEVPYLKSSFSKLRYILRKSHLFIYIHKKMIVIQTNKDNKLITLPKNFRIIIEDTKDKELDRAWELSKKILLKIKNESETHNSSIIFMLTNHRYQMDKEEWNEILNKYPLLKDYELDVKKPNKLFKKFCETENLSCLDLLDHFEMNRGKQLFIEEGSHFTKEGHKIAAEKIFQYLIENELIISD